MIQKDQVDIVKLVMQSNIALGEEYVDLTPTVKMKETKTQIKFDANVKETFTEIIVKLMEKLWP